MPKLLAGALVLGLLLAGCGGSGGDEITKAEFTKQAEKICAKAEGERLAALKKATAGLSKEETLTRKQEEELVKPALAGYGPAAEEIAELGAPKGEEDQVQALTDAMEAAFEEANANPAEAVNPSSGMFDEVNEQAKKFGLVRCTL